MHRRNDCFLYSAKDSEPTEVLVKVLSGPYSPGPDHVVNDLVNSLYYGVRLGVSSGNQLLGDTVPVLDSSLHFGSELCSSIQDNLCWSWVAGEPGEFEYVDHEVAIGPTIFPRQFAGSFNDGWPSSTLGKRCFTFSDRLGWKQQMVLRREWLLAHRRFMERFPGNRIQRSPLVTRTWLAESEEVDNGSRVRENCGALLFVSSDMSDIPLCGWMTAGDWSDSREAPLVSSTILFPADSTCFAKMLGILVTT